MKKEWTAALYIRLSKEDEGQTTESNSVRSQRGLMQEFLNQNPDIRCYDFYVDDGYSGTNFDRPGFQRMMEDLYNKRVNCVIVKDLSRLGRNAAETGQYLDNVFVRMGIRFIAIYNCIDTEKNKMNAANRCITVGVQNVINESVAATTSVNVRGTLDLERQQGKFIGSFASYGYRKDPDDRHRLRIDEAVSPIVTQIFTWYLEGKSIAGIARELNERNIPNPSAYKRQQGLNYRHPAVAQGDGLWPASSVRRILTNRMYTGTMVQGINTTISYKHKQCRGVPKEDWYVVEGTHEAIIDPETFALVQALLNRNTRANPEKKEVSLFAGLVRCAQCGRMMNKKTNIHSYGTYHYYRCTTRGKKSSACTSHTIRIDKLELAVTAALQTTFDLSLDLSSLCPQKTTSPADPLLSALEKEIREREHISSAMADIYLDYKVGTISQERYEKATASAQTRLDAAEQRIASLENRLREEEKEPPIPCLDMQSGEIRKLTRHMLVELVDEILVYEGGRIEIRLRYSDPLKIPSAPELDLYRPAM